MKKAEKRKIIGWAVTLAVMMHLLLFLMIRPANGNGLVGALIPPETHYLTPAHRSDTVHGNDVRTIWSPVLFSLPTELGFSRDLLQEKLRTRLTFKQPDEKESFLAAVPVVRDHERDIVPGKLMITVGEGAVPPPPSVVVLSENRPAPRRVYVTPLLMERLEGGIVLPPELNQTGEGAWEIHADVHISAGGRVAHVFLEQPLDAPSLNHAIIRLLYGLHFKPADAATEGRIEICSAEALPEKGATP